MLENVEPSPLPAGFEWSFDGEAVLAIADGKVAAVLCHSGEPFQLGLSAEQIAEFESGAPSAPGAAGSPGSQLVS
jgi:hypothetical protein